MDPHDPLTSFDDHHQRSLLDASLFEMCILLLTTSHPEYPLILLNNRDVRDFFDQQVKIT